MARLTFGPVAYARVRRWLAEHEFDVLHLHEPVAAEPVAARAAVAEGPIVATFHTATVRSRTLSAFGGVLQPLLEKVTARIAVSPVARLVQVEHLGGDAVEIPNGVDVPLFAGGPPLPGYPAVGSQVVGFVGRFDEPRKGMAVLLDAMRLLAARRPGLRLLVVGRGDAGRAAAAAAGPARATGSTCSVRSTTATKAAALRSMDVYCAPNLGRESFGMVLTEAMAAGAPVLASDLDAFRLVLGPARRACWCRAATRPRWPARSAALLDDPDRRAALAVTAAAEGGGRYDWPVVAGEVVRVYQAASLRRPRRRRPRGRRPLIPAPPRPRRRRSAGSRRAAAVVARNRLSLTAPRRPPRCAAGRGAARCVAAPGWPRPLRALRRRGRGGRDGLEAR